MAHAEGQKSEQAKVRRVFTCLVLFALLLLFPSATHAQEVRAYVSADTVAVGERFTLSLVAEHNFQMTATFPPADTAEPFGDLTVLSRSEAEHRYLGTDRPGTRVDSVAYEVTTFALDTARVPALTVELTSQSDTLTAASTPFTVPVRSVVPPDAQELRDLAPQAEFPRPLWPYVLLGLAALALLGLLGYYLWQRRQPEAEREAEPVPSPAVSPYESAQRRLRRLEHTTDFGDPDAVKPFYTEIADLLREYLARRLGVAAHERTTRELLHALRQHRALSEGAIGRIRRVLEKADLVKFADVRPAPDENRTALNETRAALDAVEEALRPTPRKEVEVPVQSAS